MDSILAILGAAFFGILLALLIELIHLPKWVLVAGTVTTGAFFVVVWRLAGTASAQVAVGDLVAFDYGLEPKQGTVQEFVGPPGNVQARIKTEVDGSEEELTYPVTALKRTGRLRRLLQL